MMGLPRFFQHGSQCSLLVMEELLVPCQKLCKSIAFYPSTSYMPYKSLYEFTLQDTIDLQDHEPLESSFVPLSQLLKEREDYYRLKTKGDQE